MVNFRKVIFVTLLLPMFILAQNTETSVYVYGIGCIPQGNYGDNLGNNPQKTRRQGFDLGDKIGLAKFGYGVGTDCIIPVLVDGMGWQLSAKVIINPTDAHAAENAFTSGYGGDSVIVTMDIGNWFNIPIFTGINYGYKLNDFLNVYAHVQAGINLTKQPTREVFVDGISAERIEFELTPDFGFETGLSFEILKSYIISARYLNLGNPHYDGTRTLNENIFTSIPERVFPVYADEREISMFLITLGIKL